MTLKALFLFSFSGLLISCATTHPGAMGHSLAGTRIPMEVSARPINASEDDTFELIEVTVENTSDSWLRVNSSQVVIKNPGESKISVVLGKDLTDWAEAESLKQKQEEYNKNLLKTGLAVAGAAATLVGVHNHDNGLAAAGAAALVGAAGWSAYDDVMRMKQSTIRSAGLPENHLYTPFSIPGKMFLRKWVLLNKPARTLLNTLMIEFETVEGTKDIYAIDL